MADQLRAGVRAPGLQCPWHAVLGNHDHIGSIEAQIAYTAKSPALAHAGRIFHGRNCLPDGGVADFFFIDTTPVYDGAPGWRTTFVPLEAFRRRAVPLAPPAELVGKRSRLEDRGRPSSGVFRRRSRPSWGLIRYLKPMLEEHGVRVYLNGHDHDFQHIAVDGVNYITCGGGATPRAVQARRAAACSRAPASVSWRRR